MILLMEDHPALVVMENLHRISHSSGFINISQPVPAPKVEVPLCPMPFSAEG